MGAWLATILKIPCKFWRRFTLEGVNGPMKTKTNPKTERATQKADRIMAGQNHQHRTVFSNMILSRYDSVLLGYAWPLFVIFAFFCGYPAAPFVWFVSFVVQLPRNSL